MALIIKTSDTTQATTATAMSPVIEGALYADRVFIPGLTFTDRYNIGQAGQIQVEKYNPDDTVAPKAPGSNFVDSEYQNTVININCNNGFQKSSKVPAYFQATMPPTVLANKTWDTTEAVRVGRQKAAFAALLDGAGSDAVIQESDDASPIAAATVKDVLLKDRALINKLHAHPDVVICTVDTYTEILKAAGKDFTPGLNDEMARSGEVGWWLGMLFIQSSVLSQEKTFSYMTGDGVLKNVDTTGVDYIMYDHSAFSIIDVLVMLRVIDSELFAGSKVQEELDTGFAVTNADCVLIHKHQ